MDRMNKIILTLLISFLFILPCAAAKSYTLDKALIDMTVNDDGSISVQESITFTFSGQFSFAYRDMEYGSERITDANAYEKTDAGMTPLKSEFTSLSSNVKRVKWYYSASDETKTLLITYKISDALTVYTDVAEFNWKIWGDGWEYGLKDLEGTFTLPKQAESNTDVYTWGHPSLDGKIAIKDNKTAIFQAFNIPARQ
jgi:uncharacterized membrane protein